MTTLDKNRCRDGNAKPHIIKQKEWQCSGKIGHTCNPRPISFFFTANCCSQSFHSSLMEDATLAYAVKGLYMYAMWHPPSVSYEMTGNSNLSEKKDIAQGLLV